MSHNYTYVYMVHGLAKLYGIIIMHASGLQ